MPFDIGALDLLQCIYKVRALLQQDSTALAENVALKRSLMAKLDENKHNADIDAALFESVLHEIVDALQERSELDEDYLTKKIEELRTLTLRDPSILNAVTLALQEIGAELIETGDYIDPGVGGGSDNPHNAMEHAFSGFPEESVAENNVLQAEDLLPARLFNIPTDAERSPSLFTVDGEEYDVRTPFTQQMLRFEELGRIDIEEAKQNGRFHDDGSLHIPQPNDEDGFPIESELNAFMHSVSSLASDANLGFDPKRRSNVEHPNPWAEHIAREIDPPEFTGGVAEGRMPGFSGEHTKWTDAYPPKTISVTCQTGAVTNQGARDALQSHKYEHGEFGPGGLYHSALNDLPEAGTTRGIKPKFHANLPVQHKETVWTFDGTFPPKLLMAKYGEPHILRHYNFLPVRPDRNRGFKLHTITTHEHNGPNSGVSDGFAQSFFFPGEYYDYLYAMTLAGHSTQNVEANDPKAASPQDWKRDGAGEIVVDKDGRRVPQENRQIAGDWKETMSTHWAHDHALDFTAQNVYAGNALMMNYYSALDRGNEEIEDGVNLRLPSGTDLSWGNRDYDVNLLVADKVWDSEGQLWFNPFNGIGFLGDRMFVNWLLEPYFEVRARRYRFRILNAGVSRFMKFALVRKYEDAESGSLPGPSGSNTSYSPVPFWLIANCGNLMMHSIKFDGTNGTTSGILPVQAIAERFDIVVDFSDFVAGDKLYLVNVLEHFHGNRPNKQIPLGEILSGSYGAKVDERRGDPCVMKFLEFRVQPYSGVDRSVHPSIYEVGKKQLIPIEPITEREIANAVQRNFNFVNKPGTTDEWAIETDGGEAFKMDPRRLSAAPEPNRLELWTLRNGAPTWSHNVHFHVVEGVLILRDDQLPPLHEQLARKDVVRIGGGVDSSESVVLALRFRDADGTYMMHCHNTVHEDGSLLLRFDIGEVCTEALPCPLPTWNGVKFMETKTLPTFRTGMQKDNLFYRNPELLLRKLRQIDTVVPDSDTGSYFVNGLGKGVQLSADRELQDDE